MSKKPKRKVKRCVHNEKTPVQWYNLVVRVVAEQTIEYNTELRHRLGATTSSSVAFRLE